jgi:Uma2 family endonuclease
MQLVIPDQAEMQRTTIQFGREFSDAELREFSTLNPGFVVEREGKEQLVMSPSGSGASYRSGEIYYQLREWAKQAGGLVYESSAGFRLRDGSVLAPDVAWVSEQQLEFVTEEQMEGFLPVCPELVVEVMSPSDRLNLVREKCARWVVEGARAALLLNPSERRAEVFLSAAEGVSSQITGGPIPGFPGLELELAKVWGDPRRSSRKG